MIAFERDRRITLARSSEFRGRYQASQSEKAGRAGMFTFTIDQARQVLVIAFRAEMTDETLAAFDKGLVAQIGQHGLVDVIVDYTEVPSVPISSQLMKSRAGLPSRVPGRLRIFVAPDAHVFGMLRMYSAHREDPPIVVRTMKDALKRLDEARCRSSAC